MAKISLSAKRSQIDKANATMIMFVAIAAFIFAFTLVSSRALLNQRSYQSRVIKEKEIALKQLKVNNVESEILISTYKSWVAEQINIIGGSSVGKGERDGDNAVVILDALPSKYDFPAFATSLDKLVTNPNYKDATATGTDDELTQNSSKATPETKPIKIPFSIGLTANFQSTQEFLDSLNKSIRPMSIMSLQIGGSDSELTISITGISYYQPQKTISITTKEVK